MPNIAVDNLLIDAITLKTVSANSTNSEFGMENAVQAAINTAALTGVSTATVSIAAYSNTLVQSLMQKLVNLGYNVPTLSGTNLTVTWS